LDITTIANPLPLLNKVNKNLPKMKLEKIIFLLLAAIALLVIVAGCSCDRGEELDVVAPSAPSGLTVTSVSPTSINISWSPSTDNVGVKGYKVFRDGVQTGLVVGTSFSDISLVPNSEYVYTVSAFDEAGNVSQLSAPLTVMTEDDCPTCSKWLTEISFTPPTDAGTIEAGESKSAGTLFVKNVSTSSHKANLTLSFPDAVAPAIDSLSYTIAGETVGEKLSGNSVTLNQISVPANSTTEIQLGYKIKEVIPVTVADESQISLALTATTTDESGVTEPGNRVFPSVKLDKLEVLVAANLSTSYEASAVAEDKVLFGRSVAKAFVVDLETAGKVKMEVIGSLLNDSLPIGYFWVNGVDDEDITISCSTFESKIPKTAITSKSFTLNLEAGKNVICFKTVPYANKIAIGEKVGLKITGNNFQFTNENYTAEGLTNVAGVIKMSYDRVSNTIISPYREGLDILMSYFRLYPYSSENETVYDGSLYPKIQKYSVNIKNPKWFDTLVNYENLDFTNEDGNHGKNSFLELVPVSSGSPGIVLFTNEQAVFSKDGSKLTFVNMTGSQMNKSLFGNQATISLFTNVYNNGETFGPTKVCWDPISVKYVGNPEVRMYDPDGKRFR